MKFILAIIIGYLLGSIPTGYLVGKKLGGIDIRSHGSGNIGFTNVLRVMGIAPAIIVLVIDISKGIIATKIGLYLAGPNGAVISGMTAMLGHSYSLFLGFKGGKLVATGLGVIIALAYKEALIAIAIWLILLAIFRYVSLSSIAAAISVPITMLYFNEPISYKILGLLAASFLLIRHVENIKRLLNGTEYKIGQKAG